MVKITGDWTGGLHCTATRGPSGSVLHTDAPKDNQGHGEAFSPADLVPVDFLVPVGFATCIATTMAIAARRHGVELEGLRYEATKEMSADKPRRISRLTVQLWLPPAARHVPAGTLERAANDCPVHHSLAPSVEKIVELHRPA